MIKLYGVAGSRAQRSLWALEEIGLDYEHVPVDFVKGVKEASYLALNPNGRIPTLVDGSFVLFEGLAINLYLARKYDGGLQPASEEDQARALQWSMWGLTELEPNFMEMVIHNFMLPEAKRDSRRIKYARSNLKRPLNVLENLLADRPHVLGEAFTIADLNVAGVLGVGIFGGYEYTEFPNVSRFLASCTARPAYARSQAVGQ